MSTNNGTSTNYYLFNAHGDATGITDSAQTVTKTYDYDAFGNEKNPSATDTNPFRYCGEYYDTETGTYYLRARYYDPSIGRFTQQDTHWNTGNMIHGDDPSKAYPQTDELGLTQYTYRPNIDAITQSNNLYVYCANNPVWYCDTAGNVFETVFDIVSLGVSIAEAIDNPKNTEAWVSVFADTVDLIPFVTGVGEVTRAVRIADAVGDAADTIHDVQKATDAVGEAASKGWKVGDDISVPTRNGNDPAWSTVRQRYWKNEAANNPTAYTDSKLYTEDSLSRMHKGLAPKHYGTDGKAYSMELHHKKARCEGGKHNYNNLQVVTP